ncbi:MAG: MFS transporter [Sedimentisphaerales bacterium]|nr:MFS transporter [Sedimentisphaerales bacterium]
MAFFQKHDRIAVFESCQLMNITNKSSHRVWPLYGAAFMMSITANSWWTSMPFIMRNIGGSEAHVGYAWAANMLGYLLCLLLMGFFLGSHNPKNTTRLSSGIICLSTVLVGVIIYIIFNHNLKGNLALIWSVIALGAVAGGATSLYWPFLMSWVSEDLEGAVLNRRLGMYNASWSGALLMGPLIGGSLVERSNLLPAIFVSSGLVLCFLFLTVSSESKFHKDLSGNEQGKGKNNQNIENIIRLRWIARIGLFSAWACIGLARSQFALLFTELGNTETMFGVLITIFGICNFTSMTLAGRFAFWHFKPSLLFAAQAMLAISLVLILYGTTLPVFILLFIIMGLGFGFIYSSHLYYGTCGAKKRSVQMAIHEGTISLGVVIGSGSGGYIAANFDTYQPYRFMLALVGIGFLAQIFLLPQLKIAKRKS